jgi:hypothetical protein
MLVLNLVRAFFYGLATYLILGLSLDTAEAWHWINMPVFWAVWFACTVGAEFAEDVVLRFFNRNEPEPTLTREGYREGF